jgi:hypothetical protein
VQEWSSEDCGGDVSRREGKLGSFARSLRSFGDFWLGREVSVLRREVRVSRRECWKLAEGSLWRGNSCGWMKEGANYSYFAVWGHW